MKLAPIPHNEQQRLAMIRELELIDSKPNPVIDKIVEMAKEIFQVEFALVNIIDKDQSWFKATAGYEGKSASRKDSFCSHAIVSEQTLVIPDASRDERFHDNPHVATTNGIRFYAGANLTVEGDINLGSLCVFDTQPRQFTEQEIRWLEVLASCVTDEILKEYQFENYAAERDVLAQGPVVAVVWEVEPTVNLIYVAENSKRILGYDASYLLREDVPYESIVHPDDQKELLDRMQKLIDGVEVFLEMDYRVVTPHETIRWVHHFARTDKDHQGKVSRVRGYLLDDTKGKRLELELMEANNSFDLALAVGELSTWDWDLGTNAVDVSHTWEEMLGIPESHADSRGWMKLLHPDDIEPARQALVAHVRGETTRFETRFRLQHADGHYIWLHSVGRVVQRDKAGKALRIVGIHHDITEQVGNERVRSMQEAVLSLVSEVQHDFLLVKNFEAVCQSTLDRLLELTGSHFGLIGELPPHARQRNLLYLHGIRGINEPSLTTDLTDKLVSQGVDVAVTGDMIKSVLNRGEPVICNEAVSSVEAEFKPLQLPKFANGLFIPVYFQRDVIGMLVLANAEHYEREQLYMLQPLLNTLGTLMHMRRVEEEREHAVAELRRLATTDELTGCVNRRVFLEQCELRVDELKRYKTPVSVAVIDLDHFKKVNDTYGHAAGDEVLRKFADIAREELREMDVLGRLGGEEFAILYPYTEVDKALQATDRLREKLAATMIPFEQRELAVTMSAGVTELTPDEADIDRWIARADAALYAAKNEGRNRCIASDRV
ncbi:MAG TPA: diguanylate cyclase [Pseudidiomarina sp.]|nr:diguanylate cyclase [Pseudidiomarina sp.]